MLSTFSSDNKVISRCKMSSTKTTVFSMPRLYKFKSSFAKAIAESKDLPSYLYSKLGSIELYLLLGQ